MKRRTLTRVDVENDAFRVWNAFIDLVAAEPYEDLTPIQQAAHLVFWYESEVQNGGHHQYFLNSAGARRHEALVALKILGLAQQAEVLADAIEKWEGRERSEPANAEDFVEEEREGEFEGFDARFGACKPTIVAALGRYLDQHRDEFVVIE